MYPQDVYPKDATSIRIGEKTVNKKTNKPCAYISPAIGKLRVTARVAHIFEPKDDASSFSTLVLEPQSDSGITTFLETLTSRLEESYPRHIVTKLVKEPYREGETSKFHVKYDASRAKLYTADVDNKDERGRYFMTPRTTEPLLAKGDMATFYISVSSVWFMGSKNVGLSLYADTDRVTVWQTPSPATVAEEEDGDGCFVIAARTY